MVNLRKTFTLNSILAWHKMILEEFFYYDEEDQYRQNLK